MASLAPLVLAVLEEVHLSSVALAVSAVVNLLKGLLEAQMPEEQLRSLAEELAALEVEPEQQVQGLVQVQEQEQEQKRKKE